jgi:hypothetical protein
LMGLFPDQKHGGVSVNIGGPVVESATYEHSLARSGPWLPTPRSAETLMEWA